MNNSQSAEFVFSLHLDVIVVVVVVVAVGSPSELSLLVMCVTFVGSTIVDHIQLS